MNISTAVDGALSSQAAMPRVDLTRTPDYNRCTHLARRLPYTERGMSACTRQESRYSLTQVTSLESCNLIGSNRFLPVTWILGRCSQTEFFPVAHALAKNRSGLRDFGCTESGEHKLRNSIMFPLSISGLPVGVCVRTPVSALPLCHVIVSNPAI